MPISIEVTVTCEVCPMFTLGLAHFPTLAISTPRNGQAWVIVSDGRAFCPAHHPHVTVTSPKKTENKGSDG